MHNPQYPLRHPYQLAHTHDRLSLSVQIPELGLFLVGTPAGYVSIFRLTRFTKVEENSTGNAQKPRFSRSNDKTICGFRLEHVLPLEKQRQSLEPLLKHERLLGLAVGPVQGMSDRPDDEQSSSVTEEEGYGRVRRWRVLLLYSDYTMLSYELAKYTDEDMEMGDVNRGHGATGVVV